MANETESQREVWKAIPGFKGYEVSDLGQVRSYYAHGGNGNYWTLVDSPQRALKPTFSRYWGVNLRKDETSHFCRVAVLVMLAFVGPRPMGMQVCHNDSNPDNNKLSNLRYDTPVGNTKDTDYSKSKGKRFTEEDIIDIRQRRANGEKINEIAKLYAYNPANISAITRGDLYRYWGGPITKNRSSTAQVQEIRTKRQQGQSLKTLANEYNISLATISRMCNNQTYRSLR